MTHISRTVTLYLEYEGEVTIKACLQLSQGRGK